MLWCCSHECERHDCIVFLTLWTSSLSYDQTQATMMQFRSFLVLFLTSGCSFEASAFLPTTWSTRRTSTVLHVIEAVTLYRQKQQHLETTQRKMNCSTKWRYLPWDRSNRRRQNESKRGRLVLQQTLLTTLALDLHKKKAIVSQRNSQ